MPGFKEVVQGAWSANSGHSDPYLNLFHKLTEVGKKLRKWSRTMFAHSKVQIHMALELILRLDVAQDLRPLSASERDL